MMYSNFRMNFLSAIYDNEIVNIILQDGEKIVIGIGGYDKDKITTRELGFVLDKEGTYYWYSYSSIIRMEFFS